MKVGFIGMGNMGQALAGGMISKFLVAKEDVFAYAPNYEKLCNNAEKYGFTPYKDLHQMIEKSDMIIMACKPYHVETVMPTIKDALKGKAVLSVIAGWPYDRYNEFLDESTRFQFVVPNTPAMVGEGVFILEEKTTFTDEEKAFVENIFEKLGIVLHIPSNRLDIANAIAG